MFGRNVRALRGLRGWSIRELATRCGLSTRTVVKIESGRGCSVKSELQVARGLNSYVGRLWDPSLISDAPERVVLKGDGRWFFSNVEDASQYHSRIRRTSFDDPTHRFRGDPDEIQEEAERLRLGRAGLSRCFVKISGGVLTGGYFQFNEGESYGPDLKQEDYTNFTFLVVCTKGALEFSIRGRTHRLEEGESVVFVDDDASMLSPARSVNPEDLPCKFYFLCPHLFPVETQTRSKGTA